LLKRMVEDYDGCYFMYVWWLSHDKYFFCTWSLFPFNGSSYFQMILSCFVQVCIAHFQTSGYILECRLWSYPSYLLHLSTYYRCIQLYCIYIFICFSFINVLDIVGWRTSSIRRDNELPKVYLLIFCNAI
jgi:hypothetical protein